jgi:hypothetical protein
MNLNKLQGLSAPIASIGGAGTFDGIFLTDLLAVLYASIVSGRGQYTQLHGFLTEVAAHR